MKQSAARAERQRRELAHQRKKERLAEIRRSHAEAFSRPFIDANLLTEDERREIREAPVNKQRWHSALSG